MEIDPAHRRIGGMATMPTRAHTLEKALATIAPQVDTLFLYLDKHESVPAGLGAWRNVVPLLPRDHGQWAGAGKFLGLRVAAAPCFYLCFDDDILYPPNYADRLVRAILRYRGRAVVGIHGAIFKPPFRSYLNDRWGTNFKRRLLFNRRVDLLGTGTAAFHSSFLRFDIKDWPYHRMLDLDLAMEAARQGLPMIALRRRKRFLQAIEEGQADSLYAGMARDESVETARMRAWLQARIGASGQD